MTIRGRTASNNARPSSMRSRKRAMIKCMLSTSLYREILLMQDMDANALNQTLLSYMEKRKVSAIRKDAAAKRRFRQRKSWAAFNGNLISRSCFPSI